MKTSQSLRPQLNLFLNTSLIFFLPMKTPLSLIKFCLTLAPYASILSLLVTNQTQAQTFIYNQAGGGGADYVAGNVGFGRTFPNNTTIASGSSATVAFSTVSALSPASGYTGPTFFGGFQINNTGAGFSGLYTTSNTQRITNNTASADDRLQLQIIGGSSGLALAGNYKEAIVFNLGASTTLDQVTLQYTRSSTGLTGDSLSLLIGDGTNFYVSQATNAVNQQNLTSVSFSNLSAGLWDTFDPATFSRTVTGVALPNISFVGFFLDATYSSAANTGVLESFSLASFNYTGTSAIPEPSTYAAIAGLTVLGFVACRRRRSA
jgi:hypothetical protein